MAEAYEERHKRQHTDAGHRVRRVRPYARLQNQRDAHSDIAPLVGDCADPFGCRGLSFHSQIRMSGCFAFKGLAWSTQRTDSMQRYKESLNGSVASRQLCGRRGYNFLIIAIMSHVF